MEVIHRWQLLQTKGRTTTDTSKDQSDLLWKYAETEDTRDWGPYRLKFYKMSRTTKWQDWADCCLRWCLGVAFACCELGAEALRPRPATFHSFRMMMTCHFKNIFWKVDLLRSNFRPFLCRVKGYPYCHSRSLIHTCYAGHWMSGFCLNCISSHTHLCGRSLCFGHKLSALVTECV